MYHIIFLTVLLLKFQLLSLPLHNQSVHHTMIKREQGENP